MNEKNKGSLAKTTNGKVAVSADFGEVYLKVKDGQIMRPVRAQVTLFGRLNHFYKIKKDNYAITAAGYVHLNKVASINLVTPQHVIVDGQKQHNPHVERNPRTKAIETVNVRKLGIGYSPVGNITVIDKTLFYNIYTYFVQSIQAKMKKQEWTWDAQKKKSVPTGKLEHPDCAFTGTKADKPASGKWAFFETVAPLGIWVNYEDPAILDCLDEHTQRQRFGDRMAQKIVERNILKDHPAIGATKIEPQSKEGKDVAYVMVYGYRHDLEPTNMTEIADQVEKGAENIEVKAEVIDEVPQEEEKQAVKEVAAEEMAEKEKTPAEMEEPPKDFKLTGDKAEGAK